MQNLGWPAYDLGVRNHRALLEKSLKLRIPIELSGDSSKGHAGFNALSPNSDQQQFSPHSVHTSSRDKVVRI